jgi:hypothetical protein
MEKGKIAYVEYEEVSREEIFSDLRKIHIIGIINGISIILLLYNIYNFNLLLVLIFGFICFSTLPPTKKQYELRNKFIKQRLK